MCFKLIKHLTEVYLRNWKKQAKTMSKSGRLKEIEAVVEQEVLTSGRKVRYHEETGSQPTFFYTQLDGESPRIEHKQHDTLKCQGDWC